ncbi:RNA polymerase sigma factor [Tumebacillus sp. ITR2]|uniref:RNA polymerase sigma factor n=1 Tax=Tumebacillus amylolyticus TaxID=2801339 RepID=A0ABS1J4D7_9BACL|nr:RNA polymerase sigma factor [Tumebacillus amylolyticus]MBL0385133.1 RNA polymerase sigma factor [Tumebacillus amylolyticus]
MSDTLCSSARDLRRQFEQEIEPHRADLWRYCKLLTGSPWDGEDLFQETMLKAFASLAQLWHPLLPKAYLFRIASNTWIDHCRKRRIPLDFSEDVELVGAETVDSIEVAGAVEEIVTHLPPRQVIVFILMEVFGFQASEVAGMIHATQGSVYALLNRARRNVRGIKQGTQVTALPHPSQREAVQTIIHALQNGDPAALIPLMSEHMHNDAAPGFQEFNKDDMFTGSMCGFAEGDLQASLQTLWGREVLVVSARNSAGGWELHNISHFEFDSGQLVLQKSYYFCKELLLEASRVLGIPLQVEKPAVEWSH